MWVGNDPYHGGRWVFASLANLDHKLNSGLPQILDHKLNILMLDKFDLGQKPKWTIIWYGVSMIGSQLDWLTICSQKINSLGLLTRGSICTQWSPWEFILCIVWSLWVQRLTVSGGLVFQWLNNHLSPLIDVIECSVFHGGKIELQYPCYINMTYLYVANVLCESDMFSSMVAYFCKQVL